MSMQTTTTQTEIHLGCIQDPKSIAPLKKKSLGAYKVKRRKCYKRGKQNAVEIRKGEMRSVWENRETLHERRA